MSGRTVVEGQGGAGSCVTEGVGTEGIGAGWDGGYGDGGVKKCWLDVVLQAPAALDKHVPSSQHWDYEGVLFSVKARIDCP